MKNSLETVPAIFIKKIFTGNLYFIIFVQYDIEMISI